MSIDIAAAAAAAADLGYPNAARLIVEERLSPQAIARMFAAGAAKHCGYVVAVILIAGATARHHADPHHWNGDVEKALALEALGDGDGFDKACKQARQIVSSHWQEISGA